MKNMYINGSRKCNTQSGITLVELIISISVMIILSISVVSLIVVWLQQYSISSVRNSLSADTQAAIRRISDDVRKSTKLLATNASSDTNAPTPPGTWTSTSSLLVLAQSPRKSNGDLAYSAGTYSGIPDSIIYYVNSGVLYRRVVPANYSGNVNLPLVTCTPVTAGGCAADLKITQNVKSVSYTFYTKSGVITTDPNLTTSIKMTLQLEQQQAGQTITTSSSAMMTPRTFGTGYTSAPFAIGPGGIELVNGGQIRSDDAKRDIYVKGGIKFNITQAIGNTSKPLKNVYVANQACGSNYSQVCSAEPITMGFGSIYADNICATGQSTASTAFGVLQTLQSGCTAPLLDLPPFDKGAHVAKMTSTAGSVACNAAPSNCTVSLPANTRYNGNIGGGNAPLNLTINGDLYVTGTFGNKASGGSPLPATITVAEGVTTRPVIVVNGKIGFNWTAINKNSSGISPIFISFASADTSCSSNDSCVDRTPANIYNSLQQSSYTVDLDGPGTINGSFYAYYGKMNMEDNITINGTVAGQRVELNNGNVRVNLTDDLWPS